MIRKNLVPVAASLLLLLLGLSLALHAQSQRTFVSGTGEDGNPCSISLPCRTFARAIAVVADGGEIVALDAAGYGSVAITKSVSITAPDGGYGGITESTGTVDGVLINAANIRVFLRGLTINASGGTTMFGVRFAQGACLTVDRCRIRGFATGIHVQSAGLVTVKDTVLSGNSEGMTVTSSATVTLTGCTVEANTLYGIWAVQGNVNVKNSAITGNTQIGILIDVPAVTIVENCTLAGNGGQGVIARQGGYAVIRDSQITGNGVGLEAFDLYDTNSIIDVDGCSILCNGMGLLALHEGSLIRVADTIITRNTGGVYAMDGGQVLSCSPASNTVAGNGTGELFSGSYTKQ